MFGYTQSQGGIRRGNIWQSSWGIITTAYTDWKDGLFIGSTLDAYTTPIYFQGEKPNIISDGDIYKIIKFDKFIPESNEDISYTEGNTPKRISPYASFNSSRYTARKADQIIGFPFRIYGYAYQSYVMYSNLDDVVKNWKDADFVKNAYSDLTGSLDGYSMGAFPSAKKIITYEFKPFIEGESEEIYHAQNADFSSMSKVSKEPLYAEYIVPYSEVYDRVYADYSYYGNSLMKMIFNSSFGPSSYMNGGWNKYLMIPRIAFCLPISNSDTSSIGFWSVNESLSGETGRASIYFDDSKISAVDPSTFNLIQYWNGYISYNIPNIVQKIPVSYNYLFVNTTTDTATVYRYSIKAVIEPFVNAV